MKKIKSLEEMRVMYEHFFAKKNHKIINSASLIPENDPSVLFTTAGMHPLAPYLMGEKHPLGKRLVNSQRCIRTGDIEEVGNATHGTFFEMLGNWSLGDYFKDESIDYSYEFLTSKDYLDINPNKIFVSVFKGDKDAPFDEETYEKWLSLGIEKDHIYFYGKKENWWGPVGEIGPCGPDSEIFYDTGKDKCSSECQPSCNCGKFVEIWNNVFMEYYKNKDNTYTKLAQKNVDTGMGLERVMMIKNKLESVYGVYPLLKIIEYLKNETTTPYEENKESFRVIADHIRTAVFILGDENGIVPSNTDQGYILRRLIRRTIRHLKKIEINKYIFDDLANIIIDGYKDRYKILVKNENFIKENLKKEEKIFGKTINKGIKEFGKQIEKIETNVLPGKIAFKLFDTYGFPLDFTIELAKEKGITVDIKGYEKSFKEHQEKSRMAAKGKFKGGLSDDSNTTTKLHTATHLLHKVLREKFGEDVEQRGSNITPQRLRFDFSFHRKVTKEEQKQIEDKINQIIKKDLKIYYKEMSYEQAKKENAIGLFENKYANLEKVKVYFVDGFSKEVCGGPHVSSTKEIGKIRIIKEESSSAGVRRIKAKIVEG